MMITHSKDRNVVLVDSSVVKSFMDEDFLYVSNVPVVMTIHHTVLDLNVIGGLSEKVQKGVSDS